MWLRRHRARRRTAPGRFGAGRRRKLPSSLLPQFTADAASPVSLYQTLCATNCDAAARMPAFATLPVSSSAPSSYIPAGKLLFLRGQVTPFDLARTLHLQTVSYRAAYGLYGGYFKE